MYRIIYKKIYQTEKEAEADMRKIKESVSSPKVVKGTVPNSFLVILYESDSKERIEEGIRYYRQKNLTIFRG